MREMAVVACGFQQLGLAIANFLGRSTLLKLLASDPDNDTSIATPMPVFPPGAQV
jgi:hypothetical protein